jgi:hypothetical protein
MDLFELIPETDEMDFANLKECWMCGESFPANELDQDKICQLCNEKFEL